MKEESESNIKESWDELSRHINELKNLPGIYVSKWVQESQKGGLLVSRRIIAGLDNQNQPLSLGYQEQRSYSPDSSPDIVETRQVILYKDGSPTIEEFFVSKSEGVKLDLPNHEEIHPLVVVDNIKGSLDKLEGA